MYPTISLDVSSGTGVYVELQDLSIPQAQRVHGWLQLEPALQ